MVDFSNDPASSVAEFDLHLLGWVKGEIDLAMRQGREALARAAGQPIEFQAIGQSCTCLHQAHGALSIVGLSGVPVVTAALEQFLQSMLRDENARTPENYSLGFESFDLILVYLGALMNGTVHQPLKLLGLLHKLQHAINTPASDPAELFFPETEALQAVRMDELATRKTAETRMPLSESAPHLRSVSRRFQSAQLRWIKAQLDTVSNLHQSLTDSESTTKSGDIDSANDLGEMIEVLGEMEASDSQHALFWWVAGALIESIALSKQQDPACVRLVNRIEQQLRRQIAGSHDIPQRLMREMLLQIHELRAKAERIPACLNQRIEHLSQWIQAQIPATFLAQTKTPHSSPSAENAVGVIQAAACDSSSRIARQDLVMKSISTWTKYVSDRAGSLEALITSMRSLAAQDPELVQDEVNAMALELSEFGRWLTAEPENMSEAIAIEVATALLLLERGLERSADPDFGRDAKVMLTRLSDLRSGRLLRTAPPLNSLQELSRQAQDKLLLKQVVAEIQSNLRLIENALELFFRDPDKRSSLLTLDFPATQILGALDLLNETRARESLKDCLHEIKRFSAPDYRPDPADFEGVADALSGFGFYVGHLVHGRDERLLSPGAEDFGPASALVTPAAMASTTAADLTSAADTQRSDWTIPVADEAVIAPHRHIEDAEAESNFLEFASVYAEEVQLQHPVLLQAIKELQHHYDPRLLEQLRRGMHGLKGSARMLGLNDAAAVFSELEQTFDHYPDLVEQSRPVPDPELVDLLTSASSFLQDLHNSLVAKERAPVVDPLVHASMAIRLRTTGIRSRSASQPTRLSATVTEYFAEEARLRLRVLQQQAALLMNGGTFDSEFALAAHTLRGMAATVGHVPLSQLAQALETLILSVAHNKLASEHRSLINEAVIELETIVDRGMPARESSPPVALIARLEETAALFGECIDRAEQIDRVGKVERLAVTPADESANQLQDELDLELLPLFLEEASENLSTIGSLIRQWRSSPEDGETGQSLKRQLHTIKGSARMAGAMRLGERVHQMESIIEGASEHAAIRPTLFDQLDHGFDQLLEFADGLARLEVASEAGTSNVQAASGLAVTTVPFASDISLTNASLSVVSDIPAVAMMPSNAHLRVPSKIIDRLVNEAGEVSIIRGRFALEFKSLRSGMQELNENIQRLFGQLREIDIQAESQLQSRRLSELALNSHFDPLEFDRFTRLQELTRSMTESLADVNTVRHNLSAVIDSAELALEHQSQLSRSLQQGLMRVRMVPAGNLASRLHRVVRQTAKAQSKSVNLEIRGSTVEMDRSVIERMAAPLEHLLRNAVVHGIESPALRRERGKTVTGEVVIEIRQELNEVKIVVGDDGHGISLDRLKELALLRGMMSSDDDLTDDELANLIFMPGLSTTTAVTQDAGRGVGMDVVRSEIVALGGRIELSSTPQQGTQFIIWLPLTLGILQAVMVRAAGRLYAIPTAMVEHMLHLDAQASLKAAQCGRLDWHNRLVPFARLVDLQGLSRDAQRPNRQISVLMLRSGIRTLALEVDQMLGSSQEIVVKGTGPLLDRVPGVTGATVTGNGDIALIINPVALHQWHEVHAKRSPEIPSIDLASCNVPDDVVNTAVSRRGHQRIMVVDDSLTVRRITGKLLTRASYQVIEARDGMEALQILQGIRDGEAENLPAVLLVDIEMPRMDGFELTRAVRADTGLSHLPIIMISSRTADKHRAHALEIGVNAFLGKPYQEQQLLDQISALALIRP